MIRDEHNETISGAYIYSIENLLNGKMYIGLTNNPTRRWQEHKSLATKEDDANHSYIHKAIHKYGDENFIFIPFIFYDTYIEGKRAEPAWIAELRSLGVELYNLTDGGDGVVGYKYSEEEKEANRQRQKEASDVIWDAKLGKKTIFDIECGWCKETFQFIKRERATTPLPKFCGIECKNQQFGASIRLPPTAEIKKKRLDARYKTLEESKGKLITHNLICEYCGDSFQCERREKSTKKNPIPRFCSVKCARKNINFIRWGTRT